VGRQSLLALVTDSAGLTGTSATEVTVARFKPKAGATVKATKAKRIVRTISGTLRFSSRVTRSQGCASGTVTITVRKSNSTLFPLVQVPVERDCSYKLRFAIPRSGRPTFLAKIKFGGNAVLRSATTNRRFK